MMAIWEVTSYTYAMRHLVNYKALLAKPPPCHGVQAL